MPSVAGGMGKDTKRITIEPWLRHTVSMRAWHGLGRLRGFGADPRSCESANRAARAAAVPGRRRQTSVPKRRRPADYL